MLTNQYEMIQPDDLVTLFLYSMYLSVHIQFVIVSYTHVQN